MKPKCILLAVISGFLFSSAIAQQPGMFELNRGLPNHVLTKIRVEHIKAEAPFFFELNNEPFEDNLIRKGTVIEVEIAPGDRRSLRITRVTGYQPGTRSYIAQSRGSTGGGDLFAFTWSESGINGLYHPAGRNALTFSPDPHSGFGYVAKAPAHTGAFCGIDELEPHDSKHPHDEKSKQGHYVDDVGFSPVFSSLEDTVTIDLMIVTTERAENWVADEMENTNSTSGYYPSVKAFFAQEVNMAQMTFDNSHINIDLRLVHVHKAELTREQQAVRVADKWNSVKESINGFEAVDKLRTQYGADHIAYIDLFEESNTSAGFANRLGNPRGRRSISYSALDVEWVSTHVYVLAHEMGHTMGNSHSRTQNQGPANATGALFHYSVGKQLPDFVSVMAYGFPTAPVFTGPDVYWDSTPTGSDDILLPENSALTIRQVKGAVASYYPTTINPPVFEVSTPSITVQMDPGEETTVPVTLSNTATPEEGSRLRWSLDFDFAGSPDGMPSRKDRGVTSAKYSLLSPHTSDAAFTGFGAETGELLYSTSFERERFVTGEHPAIYGWKTRNADHLGISDENPTDGTQHLRISVDDEGENTVESPYFGVLPLGNYDVSFELYVSDTGPNTQEEQYAFFFTDTRNNQETSAGMQIKGGEVSAWGLVLDEDEGGYLPTDATITPEEYHTIRVVYNTDTQRLQYYIDDELIAETRYAPGAFVPDRLSFDVSQPGIYMDIDHLQVRRLEGPYSWLTLDPGSFSGSLNPGQSEEIVLTFSGEGLGPGEVYQSELVMHTNDANNTEVRIPVTLTMNGELPLPSDFAQYNVVLDDGSNQGWRLLSPPTNNNTYADMLGQLWTQGMPGSDGPDADVSNVFVFDTETNAFEAVTDLANPMTGGRGFAIYVYGDNNNDGTDDGFPKELSFAGIANRGDVVPELNTGSSGNDAFTLVGNPFDVPVYWDSMEKEELTDVVYVYDPSLPGYKTWNGNSGSLTDGLIPPHTGFWVQNLFSEAPLLIINEEESTVPPPPDKAVAAIPAFSIHAEMPCPDTSSCQTGQQVRNSTTWFTFGEEASTGKDKKDAYTFLPLDVMPYIKLATRIDSALYDINHLPVALGKAMEIPLHFSAYTVAEGAWVKESGEVTFTWSGLHNIPEAWTITLHDFETGAVVDLKTEDQYTFTFRTEHTKQEITTRNTLWVPVSVTKEKAESYERFTLTLETSVSLNTEDASLPTTVSLRQNYPNPFNPSTIIRFGVPRNEVVKLEVFDILGRKIATPVDGRKTAGWYSVSFDSRQSSGGLSSGVYVYRLQVGSKILTRAMTLIK
ncbi:MAG: zinc-dependent metalloprotease [Bacteroidota bacterium]